MLHQQEIERREANEEWNRKWPNGRPRLDVFVRCENEENRIKK